MTEAKQTSLPTVTAIAPWFGSNRSLAHRVGELLDGCKWVGVPFAGGMCELLYIDARTVLVGDLHTHVLNLASVVADPDLNRQLREKLDALPFHPNVLRDAQAQCAERDVIPGPGPLIPPRDLKWAAAYFVCAWMGRNGTAGTASEFRATYSHRWTATGGDSALRFRNAAESLKAWGEVMRRCTFVQLNVFDFLDRCHDKPEHGIYLDPPFPGPGDDYKHTFGEEQQRKLAATLNGFTSARVVCRFYDHPLIRELYAGWTWQHPEGGRTQANKAAPEVLLLNGPAAQARE